MTRTPFPKRNVADEPISETYQRTNQIISNMCQPKSGGELFCGSVGMHLSKMEPIQRVLAKLNTQEVLFIVEFGNFENESLVSLSLLYGYLIS